MPPCRLHGGTASRSGKEIARRFFEDVLAAKGDRAADRLIAPGAIVHLSSGRFAVPDGVTHQVHHRRVVSPGKGGGVDMGWLGRGRQVSISVSPRSFLDLRAIAPSRARNASKRALSNE